MAEAVSLVQDGSVENEVTEPSGLWINYLLRGD